MVDKGKRRLKSEVQKIEYIVNKRRSFDKIKSIFHNFLSVLFW